MNTIKTAFSAIVLVAAFAGAHAMAADVTSIQGRSAPVAGVNVQHVLIKGTAVSDVQGRGAPALAVAAQSRFLGSQQGIRAIGDIVGSKYGRA